MKYVVNVNGHRHDVDLALGAAGESTTGDVATLESTGLSATLDVNRGTPVRILRVGDRVVRVLSRRGETRGTYVLDIDGFKYTVDAADERTRAIRDMTAKSAAAAGPAPLKAPMPGLIVRINVAVGDQVQAGQGLIVMEAMKMENELRATSAGTVKAIKAQAGTAVEKGALLVELG